MNESDMQLLARYAQNRADDDFAELVQRHLGLVYSAALRQVRSPELAQEVAQSVFLDLARNAARLPSSTILTAWLFQVARRTAIDVVRRETRRHNREQIAHQLADMNSPAADHWTEIEPLLDEAVQSLDEPDRAAVLLRYFENKSLREVGETLGASENAAQKRLTRAVDRLTQFFTRRGIQISSGALIAALSSNAVQAVPASLGIAVTTFVAESVLATTTATAAAATTTGILSMSAIKATAVIAALAAAVGTGIYQSRQTSALQTELDQLKASMAPASQIDQLAHERDAALRQLTALQNEIGRGASTNPELMRLRGEVSRLKREAEETATSKKASGAIESAAANWLGRVAQLKGRLDAMPQARIPELQLLAEEDWLAAVKKPTLESEEEYRRAFASLRNMAQNKVASILIPALKKYLDANNNIFPTDLAQLVPYIEPANFDATILNRYGIFPESFAKSVKMGGEYVIAQKEPVDRELDNQIVIGPNGYGNSSYPRADELTEADLKALEPAMKAYLAANNGKEPVDPRQVEPYLTTPEAKAAHQKALRSSRTNNTANSTVSR